jgi:hypothetical protein
VTLVDQHQAQDVELLIKVVVLVVIVDSVKVEVLVVKE